MDGLQPLAPLLCFILGVFPALVVWITDPMENHSRKVKVLTGVWFLFWTFPAPSALWLYAVL